jgi:hypothetical protein
VFALAPYVLQVVTVFSVRTVFCAVLLHRSKALPPARRAKAENTMSVETKQQLRSTLADLANHNGQGDFAGLVEACSSLTEQLEVLTTQHNMPLTAVVKRGVCKLHRATGMMKRMVWKDARLTLNESKLTISKGDDPSKVYHEFLLKTGTFRLSEAMDDTIIDIIGADSNNPASGSVMCEAMMADAHAMEEWFASLIHNQAIVQGN